MNHDESNDPMRLFFEEYDLAYEMFIVDYVEFGGADKNDSAICNHLQETSQDKFILLGLPTVVSWIFSCRHRIHRCSPTTLRHV